MLESSVPVNGVFDEQKQWENEHFLGLVGGVCGSFLQALLPLLHVTNHPSATAGSDRSQPGHMFSYLP